MLSHSSFRLFQQRLREIRLFVISTPACYIPNKKRVCREHRAPLYLRKHTDFSPQCRTRTFSLECMRFGGKSCPRDQPCQNEASEPSHPLGRTDFCDILLANLVRLDCYFSGLEGPGMMMSLITCDTMSGLPTRQTLLPSKIRS